MNVLFFIGNGFDLNVGLKTQFENVLSLYAEETSVDPVIISFKRSISQKIKTWSNFEEKIGTYSDEMEKKETPIETFLDYGNCNLDFIRFLKDCLIKEEKKANYADTRNIAESFKSSLLNFTKHLEIDQNVFFDIKDKTTVKYSYMCFNYTSVFNNCLDILKESKIFPLDKIRKSAFLGKVIVGRNDLGNVLHIHGTLENNMILGVNDIKQIQNLDFHNIEKINTYIKPNVNDLLENRRNADAIKLIGDADVYCVFGMSIGKTDKKWWIEICKQLIDNSEKQLIIYAYEKDFDNAIPAYTLEIKEFFKITFLNHLKYSELDKDEIKEKISKKIHVVVDKDMFNFKLT